jgi:TRAP-type C4-dicarboxylate transport system substrate-binding protein
MVRKVLFLVAAVTLLCSSYAGAETIKLSFANYMPILHINVPLMQKFCDDVNKRTGGKVEVTQYPAGTLLSAPKMAAGVSAGIADIGLAHCSYSRGRFPVMELTEMPLGAPSSFILTHVINEFYAKYKPKEWDAFHPLMFSASTPSSIQTLNKPVHTLEELKGLKIRGTGRSGEVVKALGAIVVPIEMIDMYESLRRGVMDGNMGPYEQLKSFRTGEVLKYHTTAYVAGSGYTFYVIFNGAKWKSLPDDVKKVFTDLSAEYIDKWAIEWNKTDIDGRDFFYSKGGQTIEIAPSELARWSKAVQPVIADYKKDMVAKGFKASEVDGWLAFLKERMEYWKAQEKARKIPTVYKY